MRNFCLITLASLLISHSLYAQINIQIRVKQTHSNQAKLFLYQKKDSKLIDSSLQISPELFRFSLPEGYTQGLYRLVLSKNISFDFVVADEPNISLETIIFTAEDSLKSKLSKENELFISYQKVKKSYKQQLWHLNSLMDYYTDSSHFYQILSNELIKVKTNFNRVSKSLVIKNPSLFVSSLILLELKPIPIEGLSEKEVNNFLIKNWWAEANLNDVRLLNTPTLESKLWEYIELFFDDNFTKEKQDSSFIEATQLLMNLNADTTIKNYMRYALFKNYIETEYDATTRFLYSNPFNGLQPMRLTPEEQTSYSLLSKNDIGSKALDFNVTTHDGKDSKLSKIYPSFKLIVFWSMWCPHCTEMLPDLLKTYHKYKNQGFEIIAICIDEETDKWRNYIVENNFDWLNTIEPDNGNSKVLSKYNFDGTPKFVLLNKELYIISRPSNIKQLEAKLKEVLK